MKTASGTRSTNDPAAEYRFPQAAGGFLPPPLTPGRFFYLLPSNEKSPAYALWAWPAVAAWHSALQAGCALARLQAGSSCALRQKKHLQMSCNTDITYCTM
jgi:hypothetical protein